MKKNKPQPMKDAEYKDLVSEGNPDMLFADGFEAALIGHVSQFTKGPIALYDYNKCIQILMDRDGMSYEDAVEFFEFNVSGAWVGENTPAFAVLVPRTPPEE